MSRRLLLVSPVFQGYWEAIRSALVTQGWHVEVHLYDRPGSLLSRGANVLAHARGASADRMNEHLTAAAIRRLRSMKPDATVVVRGDQLRVSWWEELQALRIPVVSWVYDELRRMAPDFIDHASIGPIATYSPADAISLKEQGIDAFHLPLAFDARSSINPTPLPAISFIGARYPEREAVLTRLAAAGIPVKAFGRPWSTRTVDRIRSRNLRGVPFETGPNLDRSDAYGIMAGSAATLNLHGDQDGFTMRTFEAAGAGALQLIDRTDVAELYSLGDEVLAFESDDELHDLCSQAARGSLPRERIGKAARARTLAEHTFDHRVRHLTARL